MSSPLPRKRFVSTDLRPADDRRTFTTDVAALSNCGAPHPHLGQLGSVATSGLRRVSARHTPGTSAGSMSPCRRHPTRNNHVRALATSRVSEGLGGTKATLQPSNQRPELAGSARPVARRDARHRDPA